MHDSHTTVLDPLPDVTTLDGDRANRFGTFLTVEAAAGVASTRSAHRSPRRRALAGVAAAGVLAGGLLAVNAVVGGPGPAAVDPAVAIEQANGWTTISITDPDATPAEIEAALEAVGIDARVEQANRHAGPFAPAPGTDGNGSKGVVSFLGASIVTVGPDDHRAFYAVESFGGDEPGALTGVSLDFAVGENPLWTGEETITTVPVAPGEEPVIDMGAFEGSMGEFGLKVGGDLPDGTISIKDGADVKVVLSTLP
jgi:hypothetical protein